MRLSKHFTLGEFTKSQTATRKGISNVPNGAAIKQMMLLCDAVLEPVRAAHGPTIISSGYRSPELNAAIGGSATSKHCLGQAADIECLGIDNLTLALWIERELAGKFDQLILEYHTPGDPHSGWVHVGIAHGVLRGQVLTKEYKKPYRKGLPK